MAEFPLAILTAPELVRLASSSVTTKGAEALLAWNIASPAKVAETA